MLEASQTQNNIDPYSTGSGGLQMQMPRDGLSHAPPLPPAGGAYYGSPSRNFQGGGQSGLVTGGEIATPSHGALEMVSVLKRNFGNRVILILNLFATF
jgi:hypothetical protein